MRAQIEYASASSDMNNDIVTNDKAILIFNARRIYANINGLAINIPLSNYYLEWDISSCQPTSFYIHSSFLFFVF